MKKYFIFLIVFFGAINSITAQEVPTKEYAANYQKVMERTQWWREARFGMFIHFGAYAVPARGEWVKSTERLTTVQYQKYIDEFNPVDFDARGLYPNIGQLNAKGVDGDQVKNIYLLKSDAELSYQKSWWGNTEPGNLFITVGSSPEKPVQYDTVVKIEMKK